MAKKNCTHCGKPTTNQDKRYCRTMVGAADGPYLFYPVCRDCMKIHGTCEEREASLRNSFMKRLERCSSCNGTGNIKGYTCCNCDGTGKG